MGPVTPPRVRFRASIRARLIALAAVLIAGIVGFLSYYFPSRHISSLDDEQFAHVGMYGELLSGQVRSAVAFSDRETARELLDGIRGDPDIVAVVLFGGDQQLLYEYGDPSSWVVRAGRGVVARRVFRFDDRVAVVTPVLSLEGPRGTLVIEMSSERSMAREQTVMWTAIAIGGAALVLGVLAASLIARRLTRRLRAIAEVAGEVTSGSPARRHVVVDSQDEIGVVAVAFNQMLAEVEARQAHLEERVAERTFELVRANDQLQAEMARRAQAELELRHAQKLESVGRLASGVAHEINTPIQFVSDNLRFVQESVAGVLGLVKSLQPDATPELAAKLDELDFEYIAANMPEALTGALDGIERVATIVRSMRTFAHAGQQLASVDLNAAITSTLTMARNEYKYIADLQTVLGELPRVSCYAGEINQAILNVVMNAAHAISAVVEGTQARGSITVHSRRIGDEVEIAIADTGGGIPEHVRQRIFDPFFTTKEVGKGTGQGLSIARTVIVEKHHGAIWFESEVGRGTTFFIRLPIEHECAKEAA